VGIAVIFPGQGAQAPDLGPPWRDHPAWSVVERAEAATGAPLAGLLLDAPAEDLTRTREAQLVVFLASMMAWETAKESLPVPVAFSGHSLGLITALVAAGVIPFDDGCRLAVRRADLTQQAADRNPGRMAALLGADYDQCEQACAAAPDACWLANDNAPGQLVIAGTPGGVDAASARAKEIGVKRVTPLNVGGAFHTPLMREAADALRDNLAVTPFMTDATAPVVSNTDAQPHDDGAGWRERLVAHLINPVRWAATMPALAELGATTFVEVGPGTTLTSIAKRAMPEVALRNVSSPADLPVPLEV
jgi:[acyl-carrier-protein] S-malonyltransferase